MKEWFITFKEDGMYIVISENHGSTNFRFSEAHVALEKSVHIFLLSPTNVGKVAPHSNYHLELKTYQI